MKNHLPVIIMVIIVCGAIVSSVGLAASGHAEKFQSSQAIMQSEQQFTQDTDIINRKSFTRNNTTYIFYLEPLYYTNGTVNDMGFWEDSDSGHIYFLKNPGSSYGYYGYHNRYKGNSTLVKLNPDTKEVVWTKTFNSVLSSEYTYIALTGNTQSVLLSNKTVYVITPRARLIAINATTGEEIWNKRVAKNIHGSGDRANWRGGINSQKNTLVVKLSDEESDKRAKTIFLDKDTGNILRSFNKDIPLEKIKSDIMVHTKEKLFRYDPVKQNIVWERDTINNLYWPVDLKGYQVFMGMDNYYFVDETTGKVEEIKAIGEPKLVLEGEPQFDKYFVTRGMTMEEMTRSEYHNFKGMGMSLRVDEDVFRVYTKDGEVLWEKRYNDEKRNSFYLYGSPSEETIYLNEKGKELIAVDTHSGAVKWRNDVSNELPNDDDLYRARTQIFDNETVVFEYEFVNENKCRRLLIDKNDVRFRTINKSKVSGNKVNVGNEVYAINWNEAPESGAESAIDLLNSEGGTIKQMEFSADSFVWTHTPTLQRSIFVHTPDNGQATIYEAKIIEKTPPVVNVSGNLTRNQSSKITFEIDDKGQNKGHTVKWTIEKPSGDRLKGSGTEIELEPDNLGNVEVNVSVEDDFGMRTVENTTLKISKPSPGSTLNETGTDSPGHTQTAAKTIEESSTFKSTATDASGFGLVVAIFSIAILILSINLNIRRYE